MANTVINTPELLNLDSTTGATILAKGTVADRPEMPTFSLDYLIVAGGSGGVYSTSPGGGAGGLRTSYGSTSGGGEGAEPSLNVVSGTSFTVTVGAGGPKINASNYSSPSRGGNSVFGTITSLGGGVAVAGNDSDGIPWKNGGSGTGGSYNGQPGGQGTAGQGFRGGSINGAPNYKAGGSGGAGGVGLDATGSAYSGSSGNGGPGLAVNILNATNAATASVGEVSGSDVYYAGGGGGGSDSYRNRPAGSGGLGGGGNGGYYSNGANGTANTGGGGGAGANRPNTMEGGDGGSGVIILRYPNSVSATVNGATQASGSPFTEGNDKITVLTSGTGTITFTDPTPTNPDEYPINGTLRFNTETNKTEYYDGTGWYEIVDEYASGFIGPATNYFDTKLYTGNGATQSIGGYINGSASFNGSSSYISGTVGATATTSFSMWVKINDTSSSQFIQVFDNNNFAIFIYSGKLNIQYASGSNSNGVAWTISNASSWNHIAGTFTSSSSTLYVNGVQKTESMNNWVNAESVPYIGNRNALDGYFNGEIDQVRIFNTALTANNITTLARGVGTAYNGAASNITWANGRFGQAAVFNGSSSYIFNSNRSATQTDTISISAWIKTSDTSTSMMIVQTESIWVRSDYILRHDNYNGTGNYRRYNYSQSTVATDNWVHVCVVRDGTSVTLYVNNTAITFNSESTSSNSGVYDGISIGARNRSSDSNKASYFDGKIDQVRIYSTALTSSQVTQLYNEHYQTKFTDGSDTAIVFTEGTGTVTFSGVGPASPQGALRTNTSYSEDGSASVIEHYNGTDWKYFDAIKYCTTNTLNFPSGAGCIASYNLDNNVDDIGNTYNGTNSNVTFTASGKFGAAAVFNGSNARIDISNVLSGFTNVYTFSIWAKIDNTNNFSFFSSTASTAQSTYNNLIRFALHQNGNYYFSFGDIYGGRLTGASPSSWRDGNWHNFVFVSTSTQKLAYVDGSLFDSTSSTKAVSGLTNIILGHYGTNYADGLIDQVRIFNDSLTSDEVSKLYNNEVACS